MGILKKHGDNNYLDNTFDNFEPRLERGEMHISALPGYLLYGSRCTDCDEEVTALRYKGRRILLHANGEKWIIHQCPPPVEEIYPDDPNVRDGDGRIVGGGWTDPGPEPDPFNDDPYMYPDIPYVPPR